MILRRKEKEERAKDYQPTDELNSSGNNEESSTARSQSEPQLPSNAIGIKTKEGVVLAAEMLELGPKRPGTIVLIDEHIGCATCMTDGRNALMRAQTETLNYRFFCGEPMGVDSVVQDFCDLVCGLRDVHLVNEDEPTSEPEPLVVSLLSLLIAGHDEKGPSLYYIDRSGRFEACTAKAIGSDSEVADRFLQEQFKEDLTLEEAETIALSALSQVMLEKVTPKRVAIAKVSPTYHLYSNSEVKAVINRL